MHYGCRKRQNLPIYKKRLFIMGRVFCLMKNELFYSLDRDDIFYQYFISKWYFLSVFYHSKQEKITWIILSTHIWAILPRPYKCVSAWDTDTMGRGGRNTQGEEAFLSFLCYLNWMLREKKYIWSHLQCQPDIIDTCGFLWIFTTL